MTQLEEVPELTTAAPSGEQAFEDIAATQAALRDRARLTLGVAGETSTERFFAVLRRHGLTAYPIFALGLLLICDGFQASALTILTPDVSAALGLSFAGIAAARALAGLAAAISPLPMAALTQNTARRALLCIVTGIAWSLVTLFTGFVVSAVGLLFILVLDGLSTGSVTALHAPLI